MTTETRQPNTVYMDITPEKAFNWLENANASNRKIIDSHVRRLARDMKNGHWHLTHQGIAFSTDGVLLDGQHRLWAIVESQMTVKMAVTFNLPAHVRMTIDIIQTRSMADVLRLAGNNGCVTRAHVSTLRSMLGGYRAAPVLTPQEVSNHLSVHGIAIRFAVKHLPCSAANGISNATTRAAIARAWYSVDHNRLADFCELLTSGIIPPSPSASALVALREYLLTHLGHALPQRRERYGKMQRALMAYLNNQPVKNLLAATREHFSIPGETPAKAQA